MSKTLYKTDWPTNGLLQSKRAYCVPSHVDTRRFCSAILVAQRVSWAQWPTVNFGKTCKKARKVIEKNKLSMA